MNITAQMTYDPLKEPSAGLRGNQVQKSAVLAGALILSVQFRTFMCIASSLSVVDRRLSATEATYLHVRFWISFHSFTLSG
jgi:hypothetical protein